MNLESGKNYTISQLFCGDNDKIMIPDLQRDYCWGDEDKGLVKGFIDDLLEMDKSQPITMGLFYGYYDKFTPEHLQLCDGQQRLTTIFLIIGVINRKLGFKQFERLLMSSFERENDDNEPYLQYAIRDSSLYFLSDLTLHYFLNPDIEGREQINKSPWFLNEFKLDPTVQSMLSAIKTIEESIQEQNEDDLIELGNFIADKLEFLFYDMGNRENGEETFVIINTTGEPLSPTQNLKPLVIDYNQAISPDVPKLWEEMETWFWQNRRSKVETEYPHTADEGMECFLNLVRLLHCTSEETSYHTIENTDKFPYKEMSFDEIYNAFKVYRRLYSLDFSERYDKAVRYPKDRRFFQQDRIYTILPTMRYCLRFGETEDEDIKRIYHIFNNMARYRTTNRYKDSHTDKLYSPAYRAMLVVEQMNDKDSLSLLSILAQDGNEVVEECVKLKFISTYKDSEEERKEVELLLAQAEANEILQGQCGDFVTWSEFRKDGFYHYYSEFAEKWNENLMDLLRRALLTRNMADYPLRLSDTFFNFGNKDNWQKIIKHNQGEIKKFLDDKRSLQQMIDDFSDESNKWYKIIKDSQLMNFSQYKNVYVYGDIKVVMAKERTSADYRIVYRNTTYSKMILAKAKGATWYQVWTNKNCMWSDNNKFNLTIDYFMSSKGYQVVVWQGKHPNMDAYPYYDQLRNLGLQYIEDGDWAGRWTSPMIEDAESAKSMFKDIAKHIDECKPLVITTENA